MVLKTNFIVFVILLNYGIRANVLVMDLAQVEKKLDEKLESIQQKSDQILDELKEQIIGLRTLGVNGDHLEEVKDDFNKRLGQVQQHVNRNLSKFNEELNHIKNQDYSNYSNICEMDWIPYSDTKCFKIFMEKGSQMEAKEKCHKYDSILITIKSIEEQEFLANLANLDKFYFVSDNAWIGLEMINKSYEWLDGNELNFENWNENADQTNDCVRMSLGKSSLGKWEDEACSKKYQIVCQKKQISKTVLYEELKNLTKVIEKHQAALETQRKDLDYLKVYFGFSTNQIKDQENQLKEQKTAISEQQIEINKQKTEIIGLKINYENSIRIINSQRTQMNSMIPIGFIYTQLPNQSSPMELWPEMGWSEVTPEYSGLFFRAEGDSSLEFGEIQQANQSWISDIYVKGSHFKSWNGEKQDFAVTSLAKGDWTETIPGDSKALYRYYIYTTDGEVRPKNTAIKLWKRIL